MKRLRLPLPFSPPSVSLGFDTTLRCWLVSSSGVSAGTPKRLDSFLPAALDRGFAWRQEALPSSHGNLVSICPALRPRSERSGLTVASCSLRLPFGLTTKAPTIHNISWLNHAAFGLPVYASCRPLDRLRKTRFRQLVRLYRTGLGT